MGQYNSQIGENIEIEYKRALKKDSKRSYLTIDEAKRLKSPLDDISINFSRIAVLYLLDFDKNGKFTLDDLVAFGKFCCRVPNSLNFGQEVEAQCTLCMWKQVSSVEGKKSFVSWFVRVFSTGMKVSLQNYENIFINADTVSTIHELLQIKESFELTPQNLIAMMQDVGIEMGLMVENDDLFDNLVPIETLELFAENFVVGFFNVMSDIGFLKEIYSPQIHKLDGSGDLDSFKNDGEVQSDPDAEDSGDEIDLMHNVSSTVLDKTQLTDEEDTDDDKEHVSVQPQKLQKTMSLQIPAFRKKQFQGLTEEDQGIRTPEIRSPKFVGGGRSGSLSVGFSKLSLDKLEKSREDK